MNTAPTKVYIASLAQYNNGHLDGFWLDCTGKDADDMGDEVEAWLALKPERGEEWAIHDSDFCGWTPDESESFEKLAEVAELMDKHEPDLVSELLQDHAGDVAYVTKLLEDGYMGSYKDKEEWAEEVLAEVLAAIPTDKQCYFDVKAYADDEERNGNYNFVRVGGRVHVISNHV